jgi:hypothetical protein
MGPDGLVMLAQLIVKSEDAGLGLVGSATRPAGEESQGAARPFKANWRYCSPKLRKIKTVTERAPASLRSQRSQPVRASHQSLTIGSGQHVAPMGFSALDQAKAKRGSQFWVLLPRLVENIVADGALADI